MYRGGSSPKAYRDATFVWLWLLFVRLTLFTFSLFYFILFFALFLRTDTFNTEKETMGGDASFKYFTAQTVVDSRIAARLNTKRNNSTCCTIGAQVYSSRFNLYI